MGETIEWSRPPSLPGAEVMRVDDSARRWRWYHETYTFCTGLAISEPAEWKYRRKAHLQTADGLMLIEPGEIHANTRITQPASFRVLGIPPALVKDAAEELGVAAGWPHVRIPQVHGGPIHRAFVALHASLEGGGTILQQQSLFLDALRLFLTHCTEMRAPVPARSARAGVERARAYINERFDSAITLDELAAAAGGVSRFHLVRSFALDIGVPPHAYQIQVRIARARDLLASGMPAAEIAPSLGFADQSHFTRHFRRLIGTTPGAYAKAVRPRALNRP